MKLLLVLSRDSHASNDICHLNKYFLSISIFYEQLKFQSGELREMFTVYNDGLGSSLSICGITIPG